MTITLAVAWTGYDVSSGPENQISTSCAFRRTSEAAPIGIRRDI
jgi:hypothetical protein